MFKPTRCLNICPAGTVLWFFHEQRLYHHALVEWTEEPPVDALGALKSTLADPNGVLQNWDTSLVNPCAWFHVKCEDDYVTRVDLGNANLSGQLAPQLGQLSYLEYLGLYSNNINGGVPSELGNLANLEILDLYMNNLSGPIPDTLGKLQRLRFLYV